MITVSHLSKTYPGKVPNPALKDISFSVTEGEFIIISGRSGSGKSTLLHQLGLLDVPSGGSISIDGIDVLNLTDAERSQFRLKRLGYVFQEYALIAEFTALQNVYLPAMALGVESAAYKQHAKQLLTTVGLGERLDHYPSELSGGEQQRVAVARALINNPKVLFADEPTANLDHLSAKVVLELFAKLRNETGQTILLVTHEPDEARPFIDRSIWLSDGRIDRFEER